MKSIIAIILAILFSISIQAQYKEFNIVYDRLDIYHPPDQTWYITKENQEINLTFNYNDKKNDVLVMFDDSMFLLEMIGDSKHYGEEEQWIAVNPMYGDTSDVVCVRNQGIFVVKIEEQLYRFVKTK